MFNLKKYRKKMFVSGRIQGRLMMRIGLYWVLYHVVLWHALFIFRYLQYRLSGAMAGDAVPFSELYGQFVIDYYPVILCAVLTLPVVVIDMLHMTHRIAGPLVRFKTALRELAAGNEVDSVTLRKGDLLTEFQDEFNQYLAILARQRRDAAARHREGDDSMDADEAKVLAQVTELRGSIQHALAGTESKTSEPTASDV